MKYMPARLKTARKLASLTQEEVASVLQVPRTAIALIEAGKRRVSDGELDQLAKLYNRPSSWLVGDVEDESIDEQETGPDDELDDEPDHETDDDAGWHEGYVEDVDEVLNIFVHASVLMDLIGLDKQAAHPPSYVRLPPSFIGKLAVTNAMTSASVRMTRSLRYEDLLPEYLDDDAEEWYDTYPPDGILVPSSTGEAIEQGEYYAELERQRLGIGYAPVNNMVDLMMDQDIWFSMVDMPQVVSGIFVRDPRFGMGVVTNSALKEYNTSETDELDKDWLHYAAQRFSIAHEYAHALFDSDREMTVSTKKRRNQKSEQRANAFAGAFLLPKSGVDDELRKLGKGQASRTKHFGINFATGKTIEAESRRTSNSQVIGLHDVMFIANRFGVSYKVAVTRFAALGLH